MNHPMLQPKASINNPPMTDLPNDTIDHGYVGCLYCPHILSPLTQASDPQAKSHRFCCPPTQTQYLAGRKHNHHQSPPVHHSLLHSFWPHCQAPCRRLDEGKEHLKGLALVQERSTDRYWDQMTRYHCTASPSSHCVADPCRLLDQHCAQILHYLEAF